MNALRSRTSDDVANEYAENGSAMTSSLAMRETAKRIYFQTEHKSQLLNGFKEAGFSEFMSGAMWISILHMEAKNDKRTAQEEALEQEEVNQHD